MKDWGSGRRQNQILEDPLMMSMIQIKQQQIMPSPAPAIKPAQPPKISAVTVIRKSIKKEVLKSTSKRKAK